MIRVLVCVFFVWGYGAVALGGGTVAIILSGIVALGANHLWKREAALERSRQHRRSVIEDEDLRLSVRERRLKP